MFILRSLISAYLDLNYRDWSLRSALLLTVTEDWADPTGQHSPASPTGYSAAFLKKEKKI